MPARPKNRGGSSTRPATVPIDPGSTETAWQIAYAEGTGFTTKAALDATGARTAVNGNALTGYLGFDLHGNTALAENASKVITDALRYDAWGELIGSTTSSLPTPWRYQGRLDVGPDASNPLYDFGARDYRPVTGAFTSLDSYAGQAIDPLSMNRFLYAEANPATFVDPDGHCARYIDDICADHQNTAAQQQAVAAQHAKDVAARAADDRETAHIKMSAGGAALPVALAIRDSWAIEALRAGARSSVTSLEALRGAREFASKLGRCLAKCAEAAARSNAGQLLGRAGALTKYAKSALFRVVAKLAVPLEIGVEFGVAISDGDTVGRAGFKALAAGAVGSLGGLAGGAACGGVAAGTAGVGALACGGLVAGGAAFGGWLGGEFADFAYNSVGAIQSTVDNVGNSVAGAVGSFFDAVTFWDNP